MKLEDIELQFGENLNKTMRIIDILNLIANEEYDKLPKKIKWGNVLFELDNQNEYKSVYGNTNIFTYQICSNNLNDEVEIIEELTNDDIEELNGSIGYYDWNSEAVAITDKINEVIRKINEMGKSE